MTKLLPYFYIIGGLLSIFIAYITIGGYVIKIFRKLFNNDRHNKKICQKIIEWFNYIDKNLTEQGLNFDELTNLENEIDFLFKMHKCNKVKMCFNARFRNRFLKFCGLQEKYRTKEQFLKFAHIKHKNLELILGLSSHMHKKKYNGFKLLFIDYWGIIRGNFHIFYMQYVNKYKESHEEEEIDFTDIQMPIKVIRMYFNVY